MSLQVGQSIILLLFTLYKAILLLLKIVLELTYLLYSECTGLIRKHNPYASTLPGQSARKHKDYIPNQIGKGPNPPHDYHKVEIVRAYYNGNLISTHGKKVPGVYVFKDSNTGAIYVGGAVNLYDRATSYFMPSIINNDNRRVYRYFRAYGYDTIDLTLFTMPVGTPVTQIVALEQYFIDVLKPDLNVDLVAGGMNGTHEPMSQDMRKKLRLERGTGFHVYDHLVNALVFTFDSKQQAYDDINIHHNTLNDCLNSVVEGKSPRLYLNRFVFSYDKLPIYTKEAMLSITELISLVNELRDAYKPIQPAAKPLKAENVLHPHLSKTFSGLGEFARHVKGDRQVIRGYINGTKPVNSLYRKQWKLTLLRNA
jgi:hypothetical protein